MTKQLDELEQVKAAVRALPRGAKTRIVERAGMHYSTFTRMMSGSDPHYSHVRALRNALQAEAADAAAGVDVNEAVQ